MGILYDTLIKMDEAAINTQTQSQYDNATQTLTYNGKQYKWKNDGSQPTGQGVVVTAPGLAVNSRTMLPINVELHPDGTYVRTNAAPTPTTAPAADASATANKTQTDKAPVDAATATKTPIEKAPTEKAPADATPTGPVAKTLVSSDQIKALQTAIRAKFPNLDLGKTGNGQGIDGAFGPKTLEAVMRIVNGQGGVNANSVMAQPTAKESIETESLLSTEPSLARIVQLAR